MTNQGIAKLRDTVHNAGCSDHNKGKLLRKYIQSSQPQAQNVWLDGEQLRQIQDHVLECRSCRETYIHEVEGLESEVAEFTAAFFAVMNNEDSGETEEPARKGLFRLIKNIAHRLVEE